MSGIMLNIDDAHFFLTRSLEEMTPEGVDQLVEAYRDTSVKDLVFCVASRRSHVEADVEGWEAVGFVAPGAEPSATARNVLRLRELRIDPFDRWLDKTRQLGMRGWLSIRANDDHHTQDVDAPNQPKYWRDHPELWRRRYHFERTVDRAFDFSKADVRERLLRLVKATVERYQPDGLEIDWMRRAWNFPPGFERQGAPLLTDLMKRIRDVCTTGQRNIAMGVRVPPTPGDCFGFGLDAVDWARLGLVDRIAPCPNMNIYDDMPVELWRMLVSGSNVLICPGAAMLARTCLRKPHLKDGKRRSVNAQVLRGLCASYFHRGADRVHFFNIFDRGNSLGAGTYQAELKTLGRPEMFDGQPRRHIVTYNDNPAPGTPIIERLPIACGPCGNSNPWTDLAIPDTAELRIHIGAVPQRLKPQVRLAFSGSTRRYGEAWAGVTSIPASATVRLNGHLCTFDGPADIAEPTPDEDLWVYTVPDRAIHDGFNMLEILPTRATTLEWAEIAFVA